MKWACKIALWKVASGSAGTLGGKQRGGRRFIRELYSAFITRIWSFMVIIICDRIIIRIYLLVSCLGLGHWETAPVCDGIHERFSEAICTRLTIFSSSVRRVRARAQAVVALSARPSASAGNVSEVSVARWERPALARQRRVISDRSLV